MKTCSKCHKTYENIEENFYKHPSLKDGYRSVCKECCKEESKKRHRERVGARVPYDKDYLKKLRKDKGLTLIEAARVYDISLWTYINLEKESRTMNHNTWKKIADYHGLE